MSINKKQAFSLAETLIAMLIIGMIALITLPSLITQIQDKIYQEQGKNGLYKISQATDNMKVLGLLETKYLSSEEFVNELSKHLKISKKCGNNYYECFAYSFTNTKNKIFYSSNLTNGESLGHKNWNTNNSSFKMIDGTSVILTYNTANCQPIDAFAQTTSSKTFASSNLTCIGLLYDINGDKGPNKINKDIRLYNAALPYSGFQVGTSNLYIDTPFASGTLSQSDCEEYITSIGKDISYFCPSNGKNYWAYAMKHCQDMGKRIPTQNELRNIIGQQLYNKSINDTTTYGTIQDTELWGQLGGAKATFLSSSTQFSSVLVRGYDEGNTYQAFQYSSTDLGQAMSFCVKDSE